MHSHSDFHPWIMTIHLRLLACTCVAGHADAIEPLERGLDSQHPLGGSKLKVGATSAFTAFSGRKQSGDHAAAILRLRQSSWQGGQVGGWEFTSA